MSLQHIQKNSPGLLPKPAKFEKNPPNGYRVIRKTKCGAGGAAGAGGARSSPIHKQASLAGRLITLPVYTTAEYASSDMDLVYTATGYASNDIDVGYTTIGKIEFTALGTGWLGMPVPFGYTNKKQLEIGRTVDSSCDI